MKRWYAKRPGYKLVESAKYRAKKTGLEFNLDYNKMVFPRFCPVLGLPLHYEMGRGRCATRHTSASIDRLDSTKGYTLDNVVVMSYIANTMKQDATPEQLRLFARWIKSTFGD